MLGEIQADTGVPSRSSRHDLCVIDSFLEVSCQHPLTSVAAFVSLSSGT